MFRFVNLYSDVEFLAGWEQSRAQEDLQGVSCAPVLYRNVLQRGVKVKNIHGANLSLKKPERHAKGKFWFMIGFAHTRQLVNGQTWKGALK